VGYHLLVTLHVFAATVWVGGVVLMGAAAIPVARKLPPDLRRQITTDLGRRARTVGWSALVVLVSTGIAMVHAWGATWSTFFDGSWFAESPRNRLLGIKIAVVAFMLLVTGLHDWWLGPRHGRVEPGTPEAERYRRAASWLGRITGVLVVAIVVLAVHVARSWA
jgi:uncharacterized membrane protein